MYSQVLPVGLTRRSAQVTEGKRPWKINTEELPKAASMQQACLHSYYRKMKGLFPSYLYGYKTKLRFTAGDFQSDSNYVKGSSKIISGAV